MRRLQQQINRTLGMQVRVRRQARGLSQADLAAKIGMQQPQISRYEHGEQAPSWAIVFRLAEVLGMSPGGFVRAVEREIKDRS